jgi:Skp family chaperone for outer membrane proteins
MPAVDLPVPEGVPSSDQLTEAEPQLAQVKLKFDGVAEVQADSLLRVGQENSWPLTSSHSASDPWNRIHSIAIVDVARLLEAHPPISLSQDAKTEAVLEIERAISARVTVHAFSLVFDVSGQSLNGVPVVMASPRAFDLTDEVLQELSRYSSVK